MAEDVQVVANNGWVRRGEATVSVPEFTEPLARNWVDNAELPGAGDIDAASCGRVAGVP